MESIESSRLLWEGEEESHSPRRDGVEVGASNKEDGDFDEEEEKLMKKEKKKKKKKKDLDNGSKAGEVDTLVDLNGGAPEKEKQIETHQEVFCIECGKKTRAAHCESCGTKAVRSEDGWDSADSSESSSERVRGERRRSYDPFENLRDMADFVEKSESSPSLTQQHRHDFRRTKEVYEVRFEPGESGLSLDEDWLGKAVVVDDLPGDEFVQSSDGSIHRGDVLVSINDETCGGLCLERVEEMLQAAQASGVYRVRFRQAIRIEDAFADDRGEAYEARSIIYKQKSVFYEPPDHMDMVYGYILRYRGEKMISFHFFREADNKFLLGAILPRNGKGRIIFHSDQSIKLEAQLRDIAVHSESARFLGSMVSNFVGTTFTMHDYRVHNPTSTRKRVHHELGCVMYATNVMGRVPNSLTAVLPRWDPEQGLKGQLYSISSRFNQTSKTRLSKDLNILQKMNASKADEYMAVELEEQEDLLTFETKKPSWNEELQAWTLNFNGRVKLASKKNFLLVPNAKNEMMDEEFGADTICLRFGKVLKDRFSLDYRHPISPFQAFAIALTTFSNKLVVT